MTWSLGVEEREEGKGEERRERVGMNREREKGVGEMGRDGRRERHRGMECVFQFDVCKQLLTWTRVWE